LGEESFREFISWMVKIALYEFIALARLIGEQQILGKENTISQEDCIDGLYGSLWWKPRDIHTLELSSPFIS